MSDRNLPTAMQAVFAPHVPLAEHRTMTVRLTDTDQQALDKLVAETGWTENMAIQAAIVHESMNTDARRRASAAYHAKREAAGLKKVTLWLSPEARAKLDALTVEHGSKDAAATAAILAL